ncbi:hypothetical protein [Streptosporangium sp. NPDC002607]
MAGPLVVGPGRPGVLPATAPAGFARRLALAGPGSSGDAPRDRRRNRPALFLFAPIGVIVGTVLVTRIKEVR